jgi:alkylhydroperoxidase family enzyme
VPGARPGAPQRASASGAHDRRSAPRADHPPRLFRQRLPRLLGDARAGRATCRGRARDVRAARSACLRVREARVALRYAELRTLDHEADHVEELERFQHTFSPVEQREIRAIVDLFTFNNRFNNTWEQYLPGASRRRERMGLCETPPARAYARAT